MIGSARFGSLLVALAAGLAPAGREDPGRPPALATLREVVPGAWAWRPTRAGMDAVASCGGALATPEGLVLVDACANPKGLSAVLALVAEVSPAPVRRVVITHPHEDHEGGLPALGADVEVLRHPLPSADHELAPGLRVLHPGRGHTDSDLAVLARTPGGDVLYAGDLFVNGYVGYLGEGHLAEWGTTLRALATLAGGDARVVPGHGAVCGVDRLGFYADYIDDFRADVRRHFEAGGTVETYLLPARYDHLGARYFLPENVRRARALWEAGEL
ncbi:MAG: MBL fold metallo-hydrolase [Planctomycetes bacterium]|nr:MBL fold metallo-hydrolase [Planctomycetota bacterium]